MKHINFLEDIQKFSYEDIRDIELYLIKDINNLLLDEKIYLNPIYYNFNKVKENSINFYNEYFILHDVFQIDKLPKLQILKPYRDYKLNQVYKTNHKVSPFDLPIELCDKLNDCGVTIYLHQTEDNQNITFCRNITFPKMDYTRSMEELYIHEICHTQTPPEGLNLSASTNDELFPIFTELLYSIYYNNRKMIYLRLNDLIKLINMYKEYCGSNMYSYLKSIIKYIESTLKAFMLLYLYDTETNTSTKTRIIDDIQAIFDNYLSIDEFLIKYDINEKDYKSKRFISHYVRWTRIWKSNI